MKKQILISLISLSSILTMNAQTWSGLTPGNIYYDQGNVGIGTTSPYAPLNITSGIGTSGLELQRWHYSTTPTRWNLRLHQVVSGNDVKWVFKQTNDNTDYGTTLSFDKGNVGIGTTTPNSPLETISGNSDSDVILARFIHRANSIEAGAGIQLGGVNDDTGFGVKILGYSNPHSNRNSRLSIYTSSGLNSWNLGVTQDKDGNVGIGTTTPNSPLETISGNSDSDVIIARFIHRANSIEAGAGIQLGGVNDDTGFGVKILGYSNPHSNRNSRLSIYTSSGLNSWNLGLTQDKDGKVGIGIKNPTSNLHISSSSNPQFQIRSKYTGGRGLWMTVDDDNNMVAIASSYGTEGAYPMVFKLGNSEKMRINPSGSIGIGTISTGTHKLAVEGTIGAREIKVEAGTWSDFVFNKDYNLRDLEEVESFISDNKHLPDIPSEKEVLENGIQVGEMNAKLLQKIEELTLYMIDINKEVKALRNENIELKEKVTKLETTE